MLPPWHPRTRPNTRMKSVFATQREPAFFLCLTIFPKLCSGLESWVENDLLGLRVKAYLGHSCRAAPQGQGGDAGTADPSEESKSYGSCMLLSQHSSFSTALPSLNLAGFLLLAKKGTKWRGRRREWAESHILRACLPASPGPATSSHGRSAEWD